MISAMKRPCMHTSICVSVCSMFAGVGSFISGKTYMLEAATWRGCLVSGVANFSDWIWCHLGASKLPIPLCLNQKPMNRLLGVLLGGSQNTCDFKASKRTCQYSSVML